MGMIKIFQGKSRPAKKKPGWQKEKAEHDAWLARINSQTLFNPAAKPKMQATSKEINVVVSVPSDVRQPKQIGQSIATPGGSTGHRFISPEVLYKEAPEMLQRELKARERKFNAAPAYNKGNDVFLSDDMMAEMKLGVLRRR